LQNTSRRQLESFSVQQFFKNAAEVWASSPHLRSKLDLQVKLQQKSKRESEESQLPSKSGGCNEHTRFQGQLRFPGKLGMCPSLAEPDSRDIPRSAVSNYKPQANKKFFCAAVFQKCCRGVGEQPTFAKQIRLCNLFFLLQLHFLKLTNSQFHDFYETSCKFRQGNGAIAARWQAKAGVKPPFAGRCRPFSLRIILVMFHVKHCIATVPPEQLQNIRFLFRFHKAGQSCQCH